MRLHPNVTLLEVRQVLYDYRLPDYMTAGLHLYLTEGICSGDFLTAVLSGDLFEAAKTADDVNKRLLYKWAQMIYVEMPVGSYGRRMENYILERRRAMEKAGG